MRTTAGWAAIGVLGALLVGLAGAQPPAALPAQPGGVGPPPAPPKAEKTTAAPAPAAEPATPATPAPEATGPIDPAVADLVKKLGDPDYRVREKAGAALEARGEKALPDLRRALAAAESPEVGRRLSVLVRKMDYDRLVAPRRVTLTVKDKTAKDILDEISKQTGYKIEYGGGPGGEKMSFEFDKTPFWMAVDKVANTAGLVVSESYDDDVVRVWNQDAISPHVCYAGPFRFLATQINANRTIQLSGINRRGGFNNNQEYMNLTFQIQSEPKNPLLGATEAVLTVATDNAGVSLVPSREHMERFGRSGYFNGGFRGHNAYAQVNLVRGARDATTIKTLKGKVGVVLLSGTVPELVIDEPLKVKNKKFVGRSVEVEYDSMAEANGTYTLTLTVSKLGSGPDDQPDYNWSNSVWQRLELVDEKGVKYGQFNANSIDNNGNTVKISGQFMTNDRRGKQIKVGPPAKLVFNEWISVTHEVTFEFKDIPLP